MDLATAKIVTISLSILVALIGAFVLFMLVYKYFIRKRAKEKRAKLNKKSKEKIIRHRPTPLKLDDIRYQRVPSQFTPLVITPTTPSQFTIPPSRFYQEGRSPTLEHTKGLYSPTARLGKSPALLQHTPKLLRTMSEGYSPTAFKAGRTPPHGKIECFLKYEEENHCLSVQVTFIDINQIIKRSNYYTTSVFECGIFTKV